MLVILPDSEFQVVGKRSHEVSNPESLDQLAVNANNEFTFSIFNTLAKDGNDVLSPISILSALSILMNGANGETLKDLKQFLRYKNSLTEFSDETINTAFRALNNKYHNDDIFKVKENKPNQSPYEIYDPNDYKHQLNIANKVIHNKDLQLLDTFINNIKEYYKGDIQSADFVNNGVIETERVNEWIRNKTNNKIQKIFDEIKPDTSLIILNAIYFKGNWLEKFGEHSTKKLDFYNKGENVVKVDTMAQTDGFNYYESIELNSQSEVEIFLPKFKTEKSYDLMNEINPKPIALTNRADFSRLNRGVAQKVAEIIHKTYISVDEKGTEAAAVTAIRMVPMSLPVYPESFTFKADHPFMYFIVDKTNGLILFCGQINEL
ncbi:unnamed protein product [Medioppia subpectinata]|uniref:Serpin domain-containing protein n=1 Tax=Medioppia subpectinata TaxID=1979941 RepID=A0A7R9LDS6_9ACAR|nr:unnamed protein product [Medioppia subpectinata]CAG2117444.1 unnamed protein product [Medioppia subpectinata]